MSDSNMQYVTSTSYLLLTYTKYLISTNMVANYGDTTITPKPSIPSPRNMYFSNLDHVYFCGYYFFFLQSFVNMLGCLGLDLQGRELAKIAHSLFGSRIMKILVLGVYRVEQSMRGKGITSGQRSYRCKDIIHKRVCLGVYGSRVQGLTKLNCIQSN